MAAPQGQHYRTSDPQNALDRGAVTIPPTSRASEVQRVEGVRAKTSHPAEIELHTCENDHAEFGILDFAGIGVIGEPYIRRTPPAPALERIAQRIAAEERPPPNTVPRLPSTYTASLARERVDRSATRLRHASGNGLPGIYSAIDSPPYCSHRDGSSFCKLWRGCAPERFWHGRSSPR